MRMAQTTAAAAMARPIPLGILGTHLRPDRNLSLSVCRNHFVVIALEYVCALAVLAEIETLAFFLLGYTQLETTRHVRAEGHRVVYGDATRGEVLEAAGIRNAIALIVSGPTTDQAAEIIRIARSLNPTVRVLSRSYYLRETTIMRAAGADEVFSGEGEVALAMTEYILGILGATPEQIDRERQRVRDEVFQREI